ncbi:S41 family peptidase [Nitrolancea hollandica]|uniref:Carboxyl-terminal protease n=1 Tax=Nitrolancea hollandica Lb TaxID=1129897 RepID=I4END9_9BACT|nr:S41 family peptidase [Nitrolancea hollandica]CCF86202.1 Carboxyl-terminal protease [Nitrolancea hollandica Lb]
MDEPRNDGHASASTRPQTRAPFGTPVFIIVAVLAIFVIGLSVGVLVDQTLSPFGPRTAKTQANVPQPVNQAWSLIHQHYVDEKAINDQKMESAAIKGMLSTLGDQGHTRYLNAEEVKQNQQSLAGNYVGVGIQIEQRDNKIVVIAPIDGSSAERAGIKPGDILTKVNGKSTDGLSTDQVVQAVRGPEGTTVDLVFDRPGQPAPIAVTLERTKLEVKSVQWVMLPDQIADIRISQFAHGTSNELTTAIRDAQQAGAKGIVLDLRSDPGGLLTEATGTASQFLKPGEPIFVSQVRNGDRTTHRAETGDIRTDLPVVVLVDHGTASAAEIVSGALQDNHRAKIVGQPTFGTGTVLQQYPLSDGSAILLGTELWLTPDGQEIRGQGIKPDIEVALPSGVVPYLPLPGHNSPDAIQQDTQLQRALDVLKGAG